MTPGRTGFAALALAAAEETPWWSSPLLQLASILVLGVGAQWIAWKLRLPSILLLLVIGFLAGPVSGFLKPDELLGPALFPIVSLSVGVILLEGGMSLRFEDLRGTGPAVAKLMAIGVPVTWALATAAAYYILPGWELPLSLLLGAILVVTGPTVIIPLLSHVRPSGTVGAVARWEGIANDPVGAVLAALVSVAILFPGFEEAAAYTAVEALRALVVGAAFGAVGAIALVGLLRRYLVPDELHSPLALGIGVLAFVAANLVVHESGLLAVTILGILLANQRTVPIATIVAFKENLRVLLISGLFILLAARVPEEFEVLTEPRSWLFLAALVLVVRPISTFLSTLGTKLSWRERTFLAFLAPRGIVAAAVASVFALELEAGGYPEPERLVSLVFFVVVGTVAIYGLTAAPLARFLGLAVKDPQGVLFLGAHGWARELARVLKGAGFRVVLVDTNRANVHAARLEGLEAHQGNILSEEFLERVSLEGVGRLLCLTQNDEVNALAAMSFAHRFPSANIYQLPPDEEGDTERERKIPSHLRGRVLFGKKLGYWSLQARFRQKGSVKRTPLTEEFGWADLVARLTEQGQEIVPLFVVDEEKRLRVVTADDEVDPRSGQTVIHLTHAARARGTAPAEAAAGQPS